MVGDSYPLSIDQGACLWSQSSKGVVYMAEEEKTSSMQNDSSWGIYVEHVSLNMMKMELHGGHSFGGTSRLAVERPLNVESRWWVFESDRFLVTNQYRVFIQK